MKRLAAALLLAACSGSPVPTAETGTSSAGFSSTTSSSTSTSSTTRDGTTTSTTASNDASSESGHCGFVGCEDVGDSSFECSLWRQDCPPGEKCAPWASGGGSSWNGMRCVATAPNPDQPGEPCTTAGAVASGLDSCDVGSMCRDVDATTGTGRCVPHCTGTDSAPTCADPMRRCHVWGNGVLALCTAWCDPLESDTGGLVLPVVHKSEFMDISTHSLVIERSGSQGLICKDGIRADLRATFLLRVNKTTEDVLRVAQLVGAERAMQPATLQELFAARFAEALESFAVGKTFAEHCEQRGEFASAVLEELGSDLNGYSLDSLSIEQLEQTPIHHLDKHNILDAKGILAITKSTTAAELLTAETQAVHSRRMSELETQSKELLIELASREASALARLRKDTGKELTQEQLEDRLLERLRELVNMAFEARSTPQAEANTSP